MTPGQHSVVLGVDVGTIAVKAGAFDAVGRELASASRGYPLTSRTRASLSPDPAAASRYARGLRSFVDLYRELTPAFQRLRTGLADPSAQVLQLREGVVP